MWQALNWMCIAREFGDSHKYREATRKMIMEWRNPSMALQLPLDGITLRKQLEVCPSDDKLTPPLGEMWKQRQKTLHSLLDIIDKFINDMCFFQRTCGEDKSKLLWSILGSMPCQYFRIPRSIDDVVSITEVMGDLELLQLRWSAARFTSLSRLNDRLQCGTRYWSLQGVNLDLLIRDANFEVESLKGMDMPSSRELNGVTVVAAESESTSPFVAKE